MDYLRIPGTNKRVACTIERDQTEIALKFGFDVAIKDEVKVMEGSRWNPDRKCWVVKASQRNDFHLDILLGKNPFAPWDAEPVKFKPNRGLKSEGGILYDYQADICSHQVSYPAAIDGAEMGVGKTLASIESFEYLQREWGNFTAWYVAPKVALMSVRMDYKKWKAQYVPNFFTIHEFVQQVKGLDPAKSIPPRVLLLDEASKFKNAAAKSSQAAKWLGDFIREYWGDKGRVLLMSGSPAPKSPLDWWMLCEIARPGFLREGSSAKFLDRVALVKKVAGESGVAYPKVITFKDDVNKCGICGRLANHELHKMDVKSRMTFVAGGKEVDQQPHDFLPMENEVEKLYKRMAGLVKITLKKNCLQLPEKVYRVIKLKPTKQTKQLAKVLAKTAGGVAQSLLLLRELSDGFQYHEELIGERPCEHCFDHKLKMSTGKMPWVDDAGDPCTRECIHCAGKKVFKEYKTSTVECDTPKVQATLDLLDEKEEDGRIVIFGAFQGTIDRICATTIKAGWDFIRRDGRGWYSSLGQADPETLLKMFQREESCDKRVAFVAHPKSAGMGLTLTASDTILYYSNSFDAEDRIQSEDRIHRHGCRGANIIDFEHLPVDGLVRENLKRKRELQFMTMGEIEKCMETEDEDDV